MCLVLPSRVVAVSDATVEVELADGQRAMAESVLKPDVRVGDYVLVDRGLVIETIELEEARTILQMYAEIGDMLDAEDALVFSSEGQ